MASSKAVYGFVLLAILSLPFRALSTTVSPTEEQNNIALTVVDYHIPRLTISTSAPPPPEVPTVVNDLPPRLYVLFRDSVSFNPTPPLYDDPAFAITCKGPLPGAQMFPQGFSTVYYQDLTELCAYNMVMLKAKGSATEISDSMNLGCACRNPGLHEYVFCHSPPFSSRIFASAASDPLRDYCQEKCRCVQPSRKIGDSGGRRDIPIWSAGQYAAYLGADGNSLRLFTPTADGTGWHIVDYSTNGDVVRTTVTTLPDYVKASMQKKVPEVGEIVPATRRRGNSMKLAGDKMCSARCSSEWRCGTGCACLSHLISAGVFGVVGCWSRKSASPFYAGGVGRNGLVGRGLEDRWACPCNATYVSEACCESVDGLVWEPPDAKMGVLHVDL